MEQDQFFVWKKAFEVGVPLIDHEHRRFLEIMNDLHAAMARNEAPAVVGPLLADLSSYARFHFANEERILEKAGYPGLALQQQEHQTFFEHTRRIVASPDPSSRTALDLAKTWLLEHILGTDRAFAVWLAARRRAARAEEVVVCKQEGLPRRVRVP
jgi:hemerythrin-like metal-binding protein